MSAQRQQPEPLPEGQKYCVACRGRLAARARYCVHCGRTQPLLLSRSELKRRLKVLQRRLRQLKLLAAALAVVLAAGGAAGGVWLAGTGAMPLSVVEEQVAATRLTAAAEPDGPQITMETNGSTGALVWFGEGDAALMAMGLNQEVTRVSLYGDGGAAGVMAANDPPGVTLYRPHAEAHGLSLADYREGSLLRLYDTEQRTRMALDTWDQSPRLYLWDEHEDVVGRYPD